ncbi:MAG: ABC transporter ATP-binding protein [Butyrivibrio sp.]|uniref:ABC transporter ATP-binding protein n=1 Tax=Butyrivibrio sp. LB2008 TaxID=1408305 RepID=UPI000565FAAF|nr:ABC transporter ATP-binding protein [Butyrivibrio sp. LB2008]MEE3493639.1 ABC transporter ATP-binding protein [Butyrivibrio sp.]
MKKVIKNQWFLWKLCFKVCPGYMIYHLYDGFRYQGIIFLEHVLGIRYVLHCAEFHEPFWKAFAYIGAILLINMIQIIPDGYFIHGWTYKAKPMLYRSLKEKMYEKAAEIDLSCYDDPKYYNDFVLAVAEAESSIDRFLKMCNMMVQGITVIVTTGAFYIMTDATGILFVLASFVLRFLVSRVLNKLNFDVRLKVNPLERKRNYVSRVFYLNDYAKELRLHPKVGDKLEKEFEETNDEIAKEQKRVGLKRTFLNFTRDYVVGDFIMDGLYITYLVFKATVLKTLAYSDAVVLFNRTSSLRRGFANIADVVPMAQENSLYIDKIRAFLDYKPKMELNVGETVPSNNAELSLKHVSFKYSEDADETLKDITLKVKPGEKIAIVGYNGAGKTTLIKLLMRLYDPTEGTITYHGKDIKDYKPCDYRRRIGVVFQDYQMYGATLLENVLMTDSKAGDYSEEAAKEALERAGFSKRLQTLPHSLDTQVTTEFDKDGINFSGGESQKIAISRAFYKDADILIMDEPSSALDPIAEYELNKAMESAAKGKTVFYISHRLSTTRDADRIILLEKGRIAEEGTHESLLEMNGKYAEMWRVQAGRYETA